MQCLKSMSAHMSGALLSPPGAWRVLTRAMHLNSFMLEFMARSVLEDYSRMITIPTLNINNSNKERKKTFIYRLKLNNKILV